MKQRRVPAGSGPSACLLLLGLLTLSPISAKSVIVGGHIPELRRLTITPVQGRGAAVPGQTVQVAVIEIDNNLPNYELVLDFSGADPDGRLVSEVRLEAAGGTLGKGLAEPSGRPLEAGSTAGQFLWSPGRQETATIRYQVRVMVTYARPAESRPPMLVSMNFAY
jgi:hypothetical protein